MIVPRGCSSCHRSKIRIDHRQVHRPEGAAVCPSRVTARLALPISSARRRLRSISGRSRRSSPSCLIRSEARTAALAPQRTEAQHPVIAGDHDLAVDQERLRLEAGGGFDNNQEAVRPVMAVECVTFRQLCLHLQCLLHDLPQPVSLVQRSRSHRCGDVAGQGITERAE